MHAEGITAVDLGLMAMMGLVSSVHCVGMCGPLIVVASAPLPGRPASLFSWHGSYHLGRGLGYAAIGALLALAGTTIANVTGGRLVGGSIQIAVGVGLMLVVLYIVLRGKTTVATAGTGVTGRVLGRLVTSPRTIAAFGLGAVTALLPCGVLYVAYARALAAPSPLAGALLAAAFWMGSMPLLLTVGVTSASLVRALGRYARVPLIVAFLMTGAWLTHKGIKSVARAENENAPSQAHPEAHSGALPGPQGECGCR